MLAVKSRKNTHKSASVKRKLKKKSFILHIPSSWVKIRERERERRAKVCIKNGQLRLRMPPQVAHLEPPGPKTKVMEAEGQKKPGKG